jgi:uncharacterized membrane protein
MSLWAAFGMAARKERLSTERLRGDRVAATFESFKHRWSLSLELPAGGGTRPLSRGFTWSMRLLCCAALGVTGYLAVTALRSGDVAGCGAGTAFDCSFVLHSRWSKVLGLPVSIPAFVLYAVLVGALFFCRAGATKTRLHLAWAVVTVGAIAAGLAAVWFIGLQVFAVGHLCVYCIAAHLCGLALCLAILWTRPLGARTTARLAAVSVLGVSLMLGAQVFSAPPQTFQVERYSTDAATSNAPAPAESSAGAKHQETGAKQQEKNPAAVVFEPPSGVPDDVEK